MTFQATEQWYRVQDSAVTSGPHPRPTSFGDSSPDSSMAASGWYRLWVDDGGAQPGQYYAKELGPVVVDEITVPPRCTRLDVWVEYSPAQKRAKMNGIIDAQVANGTARDLVEDATLERDIEMTSGGASERKSDLEDESDANLDAFDTTITPTPIDGAGFIEAKVVTTIARVTPWVGAPDDDLALKVVIKIIRGGDAVAGASARAHMFGPKDGPAGAVMTFTQDATDPNIWESQSQQGRYWQDENQEASMRLLWNSGSLPVAETRVIVGLGDRQSMIVRAPTA